MQFFLTLFKRGVKPMFKNYVGNCRVFWRSFNNMKFAWKGTFEALMVKFGGKIGTLYQMLKNAFKKHPLQNRTNVQIKGGGSKAFWTMLKKTALFWNGGIPKSYVCDITASMMSSLFQLPGLLLLASPYPFGWDSICAICITLTKASAKKRLLVHRSPPNWGIKECCGEF